MYKLEWIGQDGVFKLGKFRIHIDVVNLELLIISFTDAVEVMSIRHERMRDISHIVRRNVSLDKRLVKSIQNEYLVLLRNIREIWPVESKSVVCLLHDRLLTMVDRFVCGSLIKHGGVDV